MSQSRRFKYTGKILNLIFDDDTNVADYDEANDGIKVPECISSPPHLNGRKSAGEGS
jgi:hypothetical protein